MNLRRSSRPNRHPRASTRKAWHRLVGLLAITTAALAYDAPAQDLRTFQWETPRTMCTDGRPGSDQLTLQNGVFLIPVDQFSRPCKLRLVWQFPSPPSDFNVAREAVVEQRGEFIDGTGRRLGGLGAFRDQRTVVADIFLNQLPVGTARLGMRIRRANGEMHTPDPPLKSFARGGATVTEGPRITSFQINGGASKAFDPILRLDIATAGAQPTHIMISEGSAMGYRSAGTRLELRQPELRRISVDHFAGARWQVYMPSVGANGGQQAYQLKNRTPGKKTVHIKVRAGEAESEPASASIEFVQLETYEADERRVLEVSENNGFRHIAQPLTAGTNCRIIPTDDGFAVFLSSGEGHRCRYTLFSGRTLAPGWSVQRFDLIQLDGFDSEVERRPAGVVAQAQIIAEPDRREFGEPLRPISLTAFSIRLILRGPAGQRWQDAFAP